jgi:hypothetical protein
VEFTYLQRKDEGVEHLLNNERRKLLYNINMRKSSFFKVSLSLLVATTLAPILALTSCNEINNSKVDDEEGMHSVIPFTPTTVHLSEPETEIEYPNISIDGSGAGVVSNTVKISDTSYATLTLGRISCTIYPKKIGSVLITYD